MDSPEDLAFRERQQQQDGVEKVTEMSPNNRYAKVRLPFFTHSFTLILKLNILLGKGAHKIVYKAIDREEGFEVAWNCFQV